MSGAEIQAALDEAENEAWALVRGELGAKLDDLVAKTDDLGQTIAEACREFHRLGWIRGYKRGLDRIRNG